MPFRDPNLDPEIEMYIELFFDVFLSESLNKMTHLPEAGREQAIKANPNPLVIALLISMNKEFPGAVNTYSLHFIYDSLKEGGWTVPPTYNEWVQPYQAKITSFNKDRDIPLSTNDIVDELVEKHEAPRAVEQFPGTRFKSMDDILDAMNELRSMPEGPEKQALQKEIDQAKTLLQRRHSAFRFLKRAVNEGLEELEQNSVLMLELNFENEAKVLAGLMFKQLFPQEEDVSDEFVTSIKNILMSISDAGKLHREVRDLIASQLENSGKASTQSQGEMTAEKLLNEAESYQDVLNQLFGKIKQDQSPSPKGNE